MKKFIAVILYSVCCGTAAAQSAYTLEQILDSARQHNVAIRSARLSIDAARQQRKEAFTKYFPNISGTGLWFNANKGMAQTELRLSENIPSALGAALQKSFPPEALASLSDPISVSMLKSGVIGSVMAVQPVFAGGQIVNGNRLAKVGEDVSRLQLQLSENEVEKTAEQYFWQFISLQEKMKTVCAVEALLADIAKDVEVALKAGVVVRNDLLQVQLRQNDVASQKLKLQNGIDIVRLLLAQYCGLTSSSFAVDPPSSDGVEAPASLPTSVAALPEYQLLEKQVEAARLQKHMAVGQSLPSVGIGAGYNYHNLLDRNHNFGMVFATVSIPISGWWGGSHAIKRRQIEQQKAEAQLADNSELLKIRMQKAWNDVEEARKQMDLAQRSIQQAEENLRLNRNFYQAGTTKMSDLLEAQMLYQQACDKHTEAQADYHNRLLEYRHATAQ